MSDLERACAQLGIEPGSVVKHRVEGDELVVIASLGIRGTPKYRVPLSSLAADPEPEPEPEPYYAQEPEEELWLDEPVPLSDYGYRELQQMAKDLGVPANQSADDLRAELGFLLGKDEEE